MKIKKSELKIIIENYLNEAAPTNKKEADAFRQWMQDNRKKDADRLNLDPPDENTQNNSYVEKAYRQFGEEYEADTEYFGLGKYLPSFGDDEEESKKSKKPASKPSKTNGCVILCHWRGSKPVTKSLGIKDTIPGDILDFIFPQGHGGVILIDGTGKADYYDFGRYSQECKKPQKIPNNFIGQQYQKIPSVKKALATGGVIRHKSLGMANVIDHDPSMIFDPIKSYKKYTGTRMITVSKKEAQALARKAQGLGDLKDGELFICPDVEHIDVARQHIENIGVGTCQVYTLVPTPGVMAYNCGTFAAHVANIAAKGKVDAMDIRMLSTLTPLTQPASTIPAMAAHLDYDEKTTV